VGLEPGMLVTPSVRLVRPLGAGGMGSVWVADHLALHTQVVVKFMTPELSSHADSVARFSREAAAAAQVKSPHVVQMLDHGVSIEGIPFIVMELLEGRDLSEYVTQRGGRLALAETAEIVGQVAKALGRAHERGIVHRDIKPANIFLCEVGAGELFVKVLDFGIAKAAQDGGALSGGTKTGAVMGTPYYMSPEQIVGARHVDARADVWSLGVLVYEVLTGIRPFDSDSFGALAVQVSSGVLPRPTLAAPHLPRDFDGWFAKACARDAAARFATVRELSDALQRVATGQPLSFAGPGIAAFAATATAPEGAPHGMAPSTHAGLHFPTVPGSMQRSVPHAPAPPRGPLVPLLIGLVSAGAIVTAVLLVAHGLGSRDAPAVASAAISPSSTPVAPVASSPSAAAPPASAAAVASAAEAPQATPSATSPVPPPTPALPPPQGPPARPHAASLPAPPRRQATPLPTPAPNDIF
jgi:serine/threonine protein kinase